MSEVSNIAHVQGRSGTLVVSTCGPYDRQILREHVEALAGRVSPLTLGVWGTRWTVTRRVAADPRCAACTKFLGRVSCRRRDEAAATCIDCAMQPQSDAYTEGYNP